MQPPGIFSIADIIAQVWLCRLRQYTQCDCDVSLWQYLCAFLTHIECFSPKALMFFPMLNKADLSAFQMCVLALCYLLSNTSSLAAFKRM